MLNLLKTPENKKIKKFRGMALDEAIKRAGRLNKIKLDEFSGWVDYVMILEDYVEKALERKKQTRIDIADQRTIDELRMLDHEIWIIKNYILKIPDMFAAGLDQAVKKAQKEEEDAKRNG